jgi:hypothetical protein
MVSRVALLVALISVLAFPKIASGQVMNQTASDLVDQCKAFETLRTVGSSDDMVIANGGRCSGYIEGFVDGVDTEFEVQMHARNVAGVKNSMAVGACIPSYTLDTLIRVYLAFMEKNPKYLDESKSSSLRMALRDAYPCK